MNFFGLEKRQCALLLATSLSVGALSTVSHAYTSEQAQLCTGDAMRLCGSEIPDVDRITACMVRKRAQLSEGCRAVFKVEHATPVHDTSRSYRRMPRTFAGD